MRPDEAASPAPREVSGTVLGFPVVVIDDHELFSTSLRLALRGRGLDAHQVPVTGIDDIVASLRRLPVGLAVLDLDLGRDHTGRRLRGVELVGALCRSGWKVLVVSGGADQPSIAAAIADGAIGSLPKSSSFDSLVRTVLRAAAGEAVMSEDERYQWLAKDRSFRAHERELARRLGRLSAREREVLDLLAEGCRAAAIAERFVVSMPTVRTQIRAILAKLEVNSQLEAVALLRPPSR